MTKTTSPPSSAPTLDLEALERLAREAAEVHRLGADWDDHSMGVAPVCAAFFAALSPDVVLRLIAAARLGEAWEAAEAALIAAQGEEDGFAVNIAYWPEFPEEPWAVSATVEGDINEAAVTAPHLPAALTALATALSEAKP